MTISFDYDAVKQFSKDKRSLKIRKIDEDLKRFENGFQQDKTSLNGLHAISDQQLKHKKVTAPLYKLKKFRCTEMKGRGSRSGIRIIFAYYAELNKVILIEIYKKGKQTDCNKDRIIRLFKEGIIWSNKPDEIEDLVQ